MHPELRRDEERPDATSASHSPALSDFFETFVSLDVDCERERHAQTRAIAALVCAGLVAAAAAPLAVVSGLGLAGALVPTLVAALALGSAAIVSATGRLDATLGLVSAVLMLVGAGGLAGGIAPWAAGIALSLSLPCALVPALRRFARRRRDASTASVAPCDDRSAAQILAGPVLRFDPSGRLVTVPAEIEGLFAPVGPQGLALVERIHVLDRVAYLDAFADLRRGRGFAEIELRLQGADGIERHVALRLASVTGKGGDVSAVLGCVRDLTFEREATHRLTQTLTRAEDASQAKSRFLAAISHELRTPLNAIIGFTDILEQEFFGGFANERQKEYVGLISRSGDHLLQVVNGLLDLSRIEAGRYELGPESFGPREAMEEAAAMVRPQADAKGLVLIVQEPEPGCLFRADRRAFHQILLNLLSNAVKFTDVGCVRISVRVEGGMQFVEVEDTGVGIAAGDLPRIAKPFVRLQNAGERPGSGLGLSLVKGLCELHHGTLRVESRIGVGTTAIAAIPADCPERLATEDILKEKVVSLDDARKKAVYPQQSPTGRRSA